MTLGVRKMKLMGVAAAALLAMSTSGCSSLPSVPDWVDPTTWFGDDDAAPETGETPDLASVPDKPVKTTPDEQQRVAESLAGDRANAKYSAEALRGGNEPAATPPADVVPEAPAAAPVRAAPKPANAAPAPAQVAAVDRSMSQDPSGTTAAGTLPATQPGSPVAVAEATPPVEAAPAAPAPAPAKPTKKSRRAKPVEVAAATPAPQVPTAPVAAPAPAPAMQVASVSPSDAELGFKPSSAPPLDPSVSQFVAAPIVDRYRSTAAAAGMASAPTGVATTAPRRRVAHRPHPAATTAVGGPQSMEGHVVANLDAIGSAPQQSVMANVNGAAAVVYFPGDATGLNGEGRLQVRAVVEQFRTAGGQGYVRVVGHSSSRTANMSAEAHVAQVFKKSQDRANAVARELIRAGIPADHVLVEAVGDTQPVYYESMPKGEDGNRRAEIFLGG
jgi:outer membrane protein OmpA-like peptidoglycan-associated protein